MNKRPYKLLPRERIMKDRTFSLKDLPCEPTFEEIIIKFVKKYL